MPEIMRELAMNHRMNGVRCFVWHRKYFSSVCYIKSYWFVVNKARRGIANVNSVFKWKGYVCVQIRHKQTLRVGSKFV